MSNRRFPKKVAAPAAAFFAVALLSAVAPTFHPAHRVSAQQPAGQVLVDSLAVEGNLRVTTESILAASGIEAGSETNLRAVGEAVKRLMATGQFRDVRVHALGGPGDPLTLVFRVEEVPVVREVRFEGLERADPGMVRDSAGLVRNEPFSPAAVERAKAIIRDELAGEGIPFVSIEERTIPVPDATNVVDVVFDVEEGNRVTVADLEILGNQDVPQDEIVDAMATKPESFWWFRTGQYDAEQYLADLTANIPQVYAARGYLDFEILSDSLIIDPETGKTLVRIEVEEGPQYRIAQFSIEGEQEFEELELEPYFQPDRGGLLRALGIGAGQAREVEQRGRIFDQIAFQAALEEIRQAYYNRGYIFANIEPVVEKREPEESGGPHTVAVAVEIDEGNPAYINRISIEGNDYTHEWVIRDRIFMLPGDVYSQARLLQSYQSIQALGFFETPMPQPDIRVDEATGEVDITFRVVERQTGAINFGTSVGGGVGLSGFVGYDQPNLFGQAKEGHLRWDFGRYLNNFTLTFSDPALFRSRTSGSISLFNARDRFYSFSSGERRRVGASIRFGFPVPDAPRTRLFTGYSLSRTNYRLRQGVDDTSLFGRQAGTQSQASLGLLRSTLNHPTFPTSGSRQEANLELNGGPLGGDADFQKLTLEGQWWVPVADVGDPMSPIIFSLGLQARSGFVFGDAGRFPFDQFWLGGVQFGEQLRGYDETTITPLGFFPERAAGISDIDRLGTAFLSLTAEYAMRLNDNLSLSAFFDAGNVYRDPADFDPTRLFRGGGFGVQLVTPFGPIGLDYAYGFDKAVPGWQLHFRMGPGF